MAVRGFGNQVLTGAAQPMFGCQTTAAVVPTPDQFTGGLNPASNRSQTVVPVSQNMMFRVQDHVLIGPAANFTASNTLQIDGGIVSAINPTASNITVMGLTRNHASGEFVVLAMACAQVSLQNGAGLLNIGEYSDVSATSPTLIGQAGPTGQFTLGWPSMINCVETQHVWVQGTAADTFVPYLLTI